MGNRLDEAVSMIGQDERILFSCRCSRAGYDISCVNIHFSNPPTVRAGMEGLRPGPGRMWK